MPSFLTGLLGGFNEAAEAGRKRLREDEDAQFDRESKILSQLTASDDPEIAAASVSALAEIAAGGKRPKGGFLQRLVGGGQAAVHPAVGHVLNLMRSPIPVPDLPIRAVGPMGQPPAQAPTGASAAMPTPATTAPGGGPSPSQLPSPATPPPLPIGPAGLAATTFDQSPARGAVMGTGGKLPSNATQPREIFLPPDVRLARATMAKTRGDLEAKRAALESLGVPTATIQKALAFDIGGSGMRDATSSAAGAGTLQSVPGQDSKGNQMYATFDKRPGSPTFGRYIDPDTQQPIVDFTPRTITGSVSMGAEREAAASRLFSKRYSQLAPDQAAQADQLAARLAAERAEGITYGRGEAQARVPLSTTERFTLLGQLRDDWNKVDAPNREMRRQLPLMEIGLRRFGEGDKVGGQEAIRVTFERILDPQSVVREAEYTRQGTGKTLFQHMEGLWQKWFEGGGEIPIDILQGMVETARQFVAGMDTWNALEGDRIDRTAQEAGIDPALIRGGAPQQPAGSMGGLGRPPRAPQSQATPPPGPQASAPPPASATAAPAAEPTLPVGTRVGNPPSGAPPPGPGAKAPRMGDVYTGERRTLADGRKLGMVNGVVVELTTMDGGRTWHILRVHQ